MNGINITPQTNYFIVVLESNKIERKEIGYIQSDFIMSNFIEEVKKEMGLQISYKDIESTYQFANINNFNSFQNTDDVTKRKKLIAREL